MAALITKEECQFLKKLVRTSRRRVERWKNGVPMKYQSLDSLIRRLDDGITTEENPTDQAFRDAADEKYGCEGDQAIEIDEGVPVSQGDRGAYVLAWVYVYNDEAGIETDEEEEDEE
jgi:hypothetical protein